MAEAGRGGASEGGGAEAGRGGAQGEGWPLGGSGAPWRPRRTLAQVAWETSRAEPRSWGQKRAVREEALTACWIVKKPS